ncbi:MAG: zf-HC2 domain-containing protein [Saprospiraceae bacterium]
MMNREIQTSNCLQEIEIQDYLNQKLNPEELRRVETHIMECPLCAEAVEGYKDFYQFGLDPQLDDLKLELASKFYVDQNETPTKITGFPWVFVAIICILIALGLIWVILQVQP